MDLAKIYLPEKQIVLEKDQWEQHKEAFRLIYYSMWASEPVPFDPMEIAIHEAYRKQAAKDERANKKIFHD